MMRIGNILVIGLIAMMFVGCKGGETMRDDAMTEGERVGRIDQARDGWDIISQPFGQVDGQDVMLYTLRNPNGMIVELTNYGATVTTVLVPDRMGRPVDVALGFSTLDDYLERSPYFGCTAGRVGNRIANGAFTIDGVEYTVATNNGPNHLHGGVKGFDKRVWAAKTERMKNAVRLHFSLRSSNGDEGYPGNLDASVIYTLNDRNELGVDLYARTDKATPCNLVHHSYWNMSGHDSGTVLDEELVINAERYTPTDDTLIPTGELAKVEGTPFDFRTARTIGRDIDQLPATEADPGGYDMNFVVDGGPGMRRVARAYSPKTGIVMTIRSDQPGVQFYTGNWLDDLAGKDGAVYPKFGGYCLETQCFPDAINRQGTAGWPDVILRPDGRYEHRMVHAFTVQ